MLAPGLVLMLIGGGMVAVAVVAFAAAGAFGAGGGSLAVVVLSLDAAIVKGCLGSGSLTKALISGDLIDAE